MNLNRISLSILILASSALFACAQKSEFSLYSDSMSLNFRPLFNNKVDILLVIDNSSSMLQHQEVLSNSAPDLIRSLKEKDFDFHLGATSTDLSSTGSQGRLIGSPTYLDNSTPDINERLKEKLLMGVDGSNVEKGLEGMRLALSSPLTDDFNLGFIRPDAFLLIVVLSNENDQSSSTTQDYINFLTALKPPQAIRELNWMMHFIGVTGNPQENCQTFGNYQDPGLRYMELVQYSRGTSSTICTLNLKNVISNFEKGLLTLLTEVPLSRVPIVGSIRVTFDGALIPNDSIDGWTYDTQKNTVLFHGIFIPKTQTKIGIYFDPRDPK